MRNKTAPYSVFTQLATKELNEGILKDYQKVLSNHTANLKAEINKNSKFVDGKWFHSAEAKKIVNIFNKNILPNLENIDQLKGTGFTLPEMTLGAPTDRTLGGTKVEQTIDKILTPLYNKPPELHMNSLELSWKEYLPYAGFSGFMAYEVVTDLRYTKYLEDADDIMTWANAGPGAKRGLNRIHGRPLEQTIKPNQLTSEMLELLDLASTYAGSFLPTLEMREIEHCLWEYDKYERVRLGEGRPRAKFKYKGE